MLFWVSARLPVSQRLSPCLHVKAQVFCRFGVFFNFSTFKCYLGIWISASIHFYRKEDWRRQFLPCTKGPCLFFLAQVSWDVLLAFGNGEYVFWWDKNKRPDEKPHCNCVYVNWDSSVACNFSNIHVLSANLSQITSSNVLCCLFRLPRIFYRWAAQLLVRAKHILSCLIQYFMSEILQKYLS